MLLAEGTQPWPLEKEKKMKTIIANRCLHCGHRLPEHAEFCPECDRPVEVTIRVDREARMPRTTITNGCLYCGLQLHESVDFCPECDRPIERGLTPHATRESEAGCSDKEIEGKDELARQQEAASDGGDHLRKRELVAR
jgi:predicted amidophosphoribosyltransferase